MKAILFGLSSAVGINALACATGQVAQPIRIEGDGTAVYKSFTLRPGTEIHIPVKVRDSCPRKKSLTSSECVPCGENGCPLYDGHLILAELGDGNEDVTMLYLRFDGGRQNQIRWLNDDGKHRHRPHINFQSDGNLVKYDDTGKVLWSSNTNGNESDTATLRLQTDGSAAIRNKYGKQIWSTNTDGIIDHIEVLSPWDEFYFTHYVASAIASFVPEF